VSRRPRHRRAASGSPSWQALAWALDFAGDPGRKQFFHGTHRLRAPAETLARLRPVAPEMGVTRVANITGLDRIGIPTAVACRPVSRALAVSQGKGLDLDQARAGAIMESLESFHAERIALPLRYGSYADLGQTQRLAEVARLPLVKSTRYHSHLPILWIEGYDLLQRAPAWAPYEMVTLNFTLPSPPGFGCFASNSNGLASGNHLLEATSHAICEVVERDALALWEQRPESWRRTRRVNLATVDDAGCRELLDRYERAGVDVAVWDATSDAGIAVFHCSIVERSPDPLHFFYAARGSGCHPSRGVALSRALSEAAQSRVTYIAGSRDNVYREDYELAHDSEQIRSRHLAWQRQAARRNFQQVPDRRWPTLREDLLWELECLRAVGIESVVAFDLSLPQWGIPVVRVVVPGLEGVVDATNYAPGERAQSLRRRLT
jgi:ribosomal protein S12 methylthiotransferase accessory factor